MMFGRVDVLNAFGLSTFSASDGWFNEAVSPLQIKEHLYISKNSTGARTHLTELILVFRDDLFNLRLCGCLHSGSSPSLTLVITSYSQYSKSQF